MRRVNRYLLRLARRRPRPRFPVGTEKVSSPLRSLATELSSKRDIEQELRQVAGELQGMNSTVTCQGNINWQWASIGEVAMCSSRGKATIRPVTFTCIATEHSVVKWDLDNRLPMKGHCDAPRRAADR